MRRPQPVERAAPATAAGSILPAHPRLSTLGSNLMQGRLIYLTGPSGAGKDSLLDAARAALAERGVRIARRVITRSAEAIGEAAHSVSAEQFERMEAEQAFALSWRANGLAYGIPAEIDAWLAAGADVLVNGSRGYLPEARRRYPDLLAVLLTVEQDVLRERLLTRGRETPEQIEARLARNALFSGELDDYIRLDNSASLERSVERLLQLLDEHRQCG
uniref:Ribose 1,5-bisphosphate phosphokinase PhnN n=2 Tax=Stutzerimonas stutzeri group TaxID=136846 RepID=Q6RCC9_STUST|nr:PhnN [Stutzerimonas stutzeri]